MIDNLYIKEVCSRLPYNTLMEFTDSNCVRIATIKDLLDSYPIEEIIAHGKLILYPLNEISEDMREQLGTILDSHFSKNGYFNIYEVGAFDRIWLDDMVKILDILYSNHIDYNGLILNGRAKNANSYSNDNKFNAYEIYSS